MYKGEFTRKAFKNLSKVLKIYQELIVEKLEILSKDPFNAKNGKSLKGEKDV